MNSITQDDLNKIQQYAGQSPSKDKHEELSNIYHKLDYLCKKIQAKGFEYEIKKDPRKQAGPGKFVFQDYQWARIYPKGMKNSFNKTFAYIVGISNSLHFHIMGIKGFQDYPASKKASRSSWTELSLDDFSYEAIAEKFVDFDKKHRMLFIDTGVALGVPECIKIKKELAMKNIEELLSEKGQIVLQGPPGTGKTYTAKDLAEKLIYGVVSEDKNNQKMRLEESSQYKLVQFHPSYTYEDFVRGIIAESNGTQIEYKTVNKIFAEFCFLAQKNLLDSQKNPEQITREQWVINNFEDFKEQIQEELDNSLAGIIQLNTTVGIIGVEDDAFRYTGNGWKNQFRMKYSDIIRLFLLGIRERSDIKREKSINSLGNGHSTYYKLLLDHFYLFMEDKIEPEVTAHVVERKNYVLVIDEMNRANLPSVFGELINALEYRDESVTSMYKVDGKYNLTVPSNLLIIGTMNTADRSVGHIDYAIRRRFAFVDILPSDEPIKTSEGKSLFKKVAGLFLQNKDGKLQNSDYLSPDFNYKEVQIGHSYFLGSSDKLSTKLEYEIKPILREYLKDGILLPSAEDIIESLAV